MKFELVDGEIVRHSVLFFAWKAFRYFRAQVIPQIILSVICTTTFLLITKWSLIKMSRPIVMVVAKLVTILNVLKEKHQTPLLILSQISIVL
jgi:hypothetical protein